MKKIFRHISFMIIGALGVLTGGCESQSEPSYIDGGAIMLSAACDQNTLVQSRDGGEPTGVKKIPSIVPETIGVFGNIEDVELTVFDNQKMYYRYGREVNDSGIDVDSWASDNDNDWPYTPIKTWVADRTYTFYGYAPYNAEKAEMLATGYRIRTFYFHDIPPLGAIEYMVGKNQVIRNSGVKPKLSLTHITSRLRFMFAIGEKYDKLRKIRVKSIKISDSGNNTPYWECSVELNGLDPTNDPEIKVVKSEKIYTSDDDIELIAENESSDNHEGLLLSTEYASFSSAYNLLGKISNTILTVVYDVYDKKDLLLREDQTVSNTIDLSVFGEFGRGKCYDVKVLITPKYLYVLSDNDVMPNCVMFVND